MGLLDPVSSRFDRPGSNDAGVLSPGQFCISAASSYCFTDQDWSWLMADLIFKEEWCIHSSKEMASPGSRQVVTTGKETDVFKSILLHDYYGTISE